MKKHLKLHSISVGRPLQTSKALSRSSCKIMPTMLAGLPSILQPSKSLRRFSITLSSTAVVSVSIRNDYYKAFVAKGTYYDDNLYKIL